MILNGDTNYEYQYDSNDQLIFYKRFVTSSLVTKGETTVSISFDKNLNRKQVVNTTNNKKTISFYETNTLNGYSKIDQYEIKYDDNGNLIHDGLNTYKYNFKNKLIQINNCLLSYDHFDNINGLECDNGTTSSVFINDPFGYFGFDLIKELKSDGNNFTYLNAHHMGQFGVKINEENFYYMFDNDFNVVSLVKKTIQYNSYEYDPFGTVTQSNEVLNNRFTYSARFGVFRLPGDNYMIRERVYRPSIGRFTSLDPSGHAGSGLNLYQYCNNNPILYKDVNGKWVIFIAGPLIGMATSIGAYHITNIIFHRDVTPGGVASAAISGAIAGIPGIPGIPGKFFLISNNCV